MGLRHHQGNLYVELPSLWVQGTVLLVIYQNYIVENVYNVQAYVYYINFYITSVSITRSILEANQIETQRG